MLYKLLKITGIKKGRYCPEHAVHESVAFGILLAIVGGLLDAYTFIDCGGVFANAQTGNIVLLGVYAAQREWMQAIVHIPPIIAFVLGVFVTEFIKNMSGRVARLDWTKATLVLEIVVLFVIGFLPESAPDSIITVIISFVASIQVSSFRKLVDSPYSTTMSTGNLRTAAHAAFTAITQKDKASAARSIRFFVIIFFFAIGALGGGLLTMAAGIKAVWGACLFLAAAIALYCSDKSDA